MRAYTLINDTGPDNHIGCDAVVSSIRRAASQHGWHEVASHKVGQWITGSDYERLLSRSELVVINGEGSLHDDARACKNIAHFAAVAKEQAKRVVLLNASYSNNSAATSRLLAACEVLAFRESHAAAAFKAHVPQAYVRVTADLSLLSFPRTTRPKGGEIGVTDSVLQARTLDLFTIGQRLDARYVCVQDHPSKWRKNAALLASSRAYLDAVKHGDGHGRLWLDTVRRNHRSHFAEHVGDMGLLITGRFHAVMYCIANDLPFLYMASNTDKIDHVLADVGLDAARRKVSSATDVLLTGPKANLMKSTAFSCQELAALERYRRTYVKAAEELLSHVFS